MQFINIFKYIKNMFEQKEYLSCNWLEHGINFDRNCIKICCMMFHKGGGPRPLLYNGDYFNYKKYYSILRKLRKFHKKGNILPFCEGCINLTSKKWDNKNYISHINFDSNMSCNSNCIYCKSPKDSKIYYRYETVKDLLNKKILIPDGEVMFGGGEPTIHPEFERIVNLLLDNNFNHIKVHSSGIKYSQAIERALSENKAEVVISPDSGEKDLYKTIKGVDCFDETWGNIARYTKAQKDNKNQMKIKYIIIPDINDSKEHVDKFLLKAKEAETSAIRLDIECVWYQYNRNNETVLAPYFDLFVYIENRAKELGIEELCYQAQAQTAISEHSGLYEKAKITAAEA